MTIAQTLLPEFDNEMATTRKLLERVPEADAEWKPHPKSMTMGRLATHIASLPVWAISTMEQTEFDFSGANAEKAKEPAFESTRALVEMFDRNLKSARAVIERGSDEDMAVTWSLRAGDHRIFSMPRAGVLRSFIMSHIIHHRGQLSVYLRLRDVPLPSIYGPTADT